MARPFTFLFTDIVGSTQLWEEHPQAMSASLKIHDELMRAALDDFGGETFSNAGDAFAAAFSNSHDALGAAVVCQTALAAAEWNGGPAIEVRIGLHQGHAEQRSNNFFGPALNLAARVCDAGHGGQILITEDVDTELGQVIVSCGWHRLKGVSRAKRLLQVGDGSFPQLRTLHKSMSNLPTKGTDLIGRGIELGQVAELLQQSRLVSLVGVGGVGKTSLGLEAAAQHLDYFADGVWSAELSSCTDSASVISTVAETLHVPSPGSETRLAELVSGHELLLILDNCEHVVDEVVELCEALLTTTDRLKILTTSRTRLGLLGERVLRVEPLQAGGDAEDLFIRRAQQIGVEITDDDMATITEICAKLDGIPLAIELAAATARLMTTSEMTERLEDRFSLLRSSTRGRGQARHETLAAAIDWSYESLDDDLQTLFCRMSVFNSGFPLDAAEFISSDLDVPALHLLGELVDRSLLSVETHDRRTRYRSLETLRQYGRERLVERGQTESSLELHAQWTLKFVDEMATDAFGDAETTCISRLVDESANLRVAISRLLDSAQGDRAADLMLGLLDFAYASNVLAELIGPLVTAGVVATHPRRRELLAIELIRRATADGTEGRMSLAAELASEARPDDPGAMQITVMMIANALKRSVEPQFMLDMAERARELSDQQESARLLTAAMLGSFYSEIVPTDMGAVSEAIEAAGRAGMKRLLMPAGAMACLGGLATSNPVAGTEAALPILEHLDELPASIMSGGLVTLYTECAVQADLSIGDQLAAVRRLGPTLQGDFNRLGLVLARLVARHTDLRLAVRAIGACAAESRSEFSTHQRATIMEHAANELGEDEIDRLLDQGASSELSDLYRDLWGSLEPLM